MLPRHFVTHAMMDGPLAKPWTVSLLQMLACDVDAVLNIESVDAVCTLEEGLRSGLARSESWSSISYTAGAN